MRRLGRNLRQRQRSGTKTLVQQAVAVLRKLGDGVTAWIPGVGLVNGLQAGNWLDSIGTTAITVDNPMGLVLDAAGSVGSEIKSTGTLAQRGVSTASTYDTTTGVGSISRVNSTNQSSVVFACNANSTYRITVTNSTANLLNIRDGSDIGTLLQQVPANTTATYHLKFSLTSIAIAAASDGVTVNFTISSIKEVTGIHALQATTANKPILRRGAVNLLLQSGLAGVVAGTPGTPPTSWSFGEQTGTIVSSTLDGSAYKIKVSATAQRHWFTQSVAVLANTNYSASVYVSENSGVESQSLFNIVNSPVGTTVTYYVDGNVINAGTYVPVAGTRVTAVISVGATAGTTQIRLGIGCNAIETGTVELWKPQLELGSTASTYIPTTTAPASSPVGSYFWSFDGTDLLTSTFPAGYEAATIISTSDVGQNTKEAVNVVGDYKLAGAVIGSDLIINAADREFSSDTGYWNKNTGWAITGGKLVATAAAQYSTTSKPTLLTVGKKYLITLTVELTTGAPAIAAGATNSTNLVAGINRVIIVPTTNSTFYITNNSATAFTGTIDNISILELSDKEYGHFIFKTAPSASDLAVMQRYANRMAGL